MPVYNIQFPELAQVIQVSSNKIKAITLLRQAAKDTGGENSVLSLKEAKDCVAELAVVVYTGDNKTYTKQVIAIANKYNMVVKGIGSNYEKVNWTNYFGPSDAVSTMTNCYAIKVEVMYTVETDVTTSFSPVGFAMDLQQALKGAEVTVGGREYLISNVYTTKADFT